MVVPKWSSNFLHLHYIYHLDSSWFKVEIWRNLLELQQTFSLLFRLSVHWSHQRLHLNTHSLVELHTPMWLFFQDWCKILENFLWPKKCFPTTMFYSSLISFAVPEGNQQQKLIFQRGLAKEKFCQCFQKVTKHHHWQLLGATPFHMKVLVLFSFLPT